MMTATLRFRQQIKQTDLDAIARIVKSSGFFSAAEIELALELAGDKINCGTSSSYQFLFGEDNDFVLGYTCFGLIPATAGSYDLYWIAVDNHWRSQGLGRLLMDKTEEIVRVSGGKHIYAETSSRSQYQPTQAFYLGCGYREEAFLKDFYAEGDSKLIYSKALF